MKMNTHAEHIRRSGTRGLGRVLIGIALAVTGVIWLAKSAGLMSAAIGGSGLVWPIVIIVLGAIMISRHGARKHKAEEVR